MLESLFNKIADLKACNFIKKGLQHRCFSVNIAKSLITPFFTEHLRWLLEKVGTLYMKSSTPSSKGIIQKSGTGSKILRLEHFNTTFSKNIHSRRTIFIPPNSFQTLCQPKSYLSIIDWQFIVSILMVK